MSSDEDVFIRLGERLAAQKNTAFDLWTHLPSAAAAQRGHGDYFSEFTPSPTDVMREAAAFIHDRCAPDAAALRDNPLYRCPCDECEHA